MVFFTITAEILARSLANFFRQYADRHMNLTFVQRISERERAIRPICYRKKNWCQFLMSLSRYWQWISSSHCQSSLRIHLAIASWIHSYFDNVMTKFMINNRTDAWTTDVNLLNIDKSVTQLENTPLIKFIRNYMYIRDQSGIFFHILTSADIDDIIFRFFVTVNLSI